MQAMIRRSSGKMWVCTLLLAGLVWGCDADKDPPTSPGEDPIDMASPEPDMDVDATPEDRTCDSLAATSTFDAIQRGIFERHNCIGCHNDTLTEGGLDLRAEVAHENLVNAPATNPWGDLEVRVFPGEQAESLLYQKLEAKVNGTEIPAEAGDPMPPGAREALTEDELEAVRRWIRAGGPKTGVVSGTQNLIDCGLPDAADPNKLPPLAPPAAGEGVQFIAGPWAVAPTSEDEVCFATHWDFTQTDDVPESAQLPCPQQRLDGQDCFAINSNLLAQDPQSHHSIVGIYYGPTSPLDSTWGKWTCHGGEYDGSDCDPTQIGVSATDGGADCGERAACASAVKSSTACVGWGPPDARQYQMNFSGSQEPISRWPYPEGVYSALPMKGIIIWNSHAFNLTEKETTLEQYINVEFADPDEQQYVSRGGILHTRDIFSMFILPFQQQEICSTWTATKGARITRLGSHVHKRGTLFRIWGPPQDPDCTPDNGCLPDESDPFYTSTLYDDAVEHLYDPPIAHDEEAAEDRTYKFCAVFDNGFTDPSTVKRHSASVGSGCHSSNRACVAGPQQGMVCGGDDATCDTSEGAGDGECDACPVEGGVTTEDEMFLLLGNYYVVD
jgi:hypothetical protein